MDYTASTPKYLIRDLSSCFIGARAAYAAAKLGVADHIGDGGATITELAKATAANEEALYRLMRFLAGLKVFHEQAERCFSHSPASEYLSSDHEQSEPSAVIFRGEETSQGYEEILHSLRTLEPGFDQRFGGSMFDYLKSNEDVYANFQSAMRSVTIFESQAILKAYDFSGFKKIIDVGGGNGTNLSAILAAHPDSSGILFDMAAPIEMARAGAGGPMARCELVVGNFFEEITSGGDLYILKTVLHDWYDDEAVQILKNCRRAMAPESTLIIIERLIGPPNQYSHALNQDMTMMVIVGGLERREEEFRHIIDQAGLILHRSLKTDAEVAILECRRA